MHDFVEIVQFSPINSEVIWNLLTFWIKYQLIQSLLIWSRRDELIPSSLGIQWLLETEHHFLSLFPLYSYVYTSSNA